jgi:hypothetical protein
MERVCSSEINVGSVDEDKVKIPCVSEGLGPVIVIPVVTKRVDALIAIFAKKAVTVMTEKATMVRVTV